MSNGEWVTYKFVEVKWRDANSSASWDKKADLPKGSPCVTRGWLVGETLEEIQIAATIGYPNGPKEDPEFNQSIAIPQGMVEELQEMTWPVP